MNQTFDLDGGCWGVVSKTDRHVHLSVYDASLVASLTLTLSPTAAARLHHHLAAVLTADQPPVS